MSLPLSICSLACIHGRLSARIAAKSGALSRMCAAGLTNADQRITEDVEKFSFAIAELVRPVAAARVPY